MLPTVRFSPRLDVAARREIRYRFAASVWASDQPLLELPLPADRKGERVELTADGSRLLVRTSDRRIIVHDAEIPQPPEVSADAGDPSNQTFRFHGLGDLPGGESQSIASGVTANGEVVVGFSSTAHGDDLFRWTESDGIRRIGPPRPQVQNTNAESVSNDGTVICGSGHVVSPRGNFALLFPTANSVIRIAPSPSYARDISGDGTIVVGYQRIDRT